MERSKRLQIYNKLNANTYLDILRHFPKRYDSLDIDVINELPTTYQNLVLFGYANNIVCINNGNIIRFDIFSYNSKISLKAIIFGQSYYQSLLKSGKDLYFFGTYSLKQKAVIINSVLSSNNLLVANKYKPYYSLPSNVSQSNFYILVNELLQENKDYIVNNIPKKYIQKYKLEDLYQAYKDVHIPQSEETIKRGLRVFKYIEALKYALYNLYIYNNKQIVKKEALKNIDKSKINEFILHLPYKLTRDQIQAIKEIVLDMDSSKIMNRLLEGDVGTGKTIVCFISMYANYLRGGQSCLLAPTTALANQHYLNALDVFKDYNLKICLLDGNSSSKEALKNIKNGNYDIIIGTHAVFAKKVEYKNLTLCVIDEQHKFGVTQREEIIKKGELVDTLMMSATPIPQTLTKIIVSDLDVSCLKEFPFNQRLVETKVINSNSLLIDKAIKHALEVKKQVYVVAPKIEQSDQSNKLSTKFIYDELVIKYGQENVALLTGKTKKEDQEQIYNDFKQGKKLILVSTSLIEVGVDVKQACLLIVYEANYFGLASLHQLRGRIGRNGQGALALLVYDKEDPVALDKLNYLANNNDGEKIAIYDLRLRGGGDLLSYRQTGSSLLQVANFVDDQNIFVCAKQDAQEIINNLNIKENSLFLQDVLDQINKDKDNK